MNNRNKFTEMAIGHHMALGQIAKELLEINHKIEQVNSKKRPESKLIGCNILNLFIKLLA